MNSVISITENFHFRSYKADILKEANLLAIK